MRARCAVSVDGLRRRIVKQHVKVVTRCAVGIAVDQLHARAVRRFKSYLRIAAPSVGDKHPKIDVCNGEDIADNKCSN